MALKKVVIDDKEIEVPGNLALIQACEEAGAEIPRFCYHERLSVAGNCRMCLVEVKGAPKPMASCAVTVNDLRPGPNGEPPVVSTSSALVKKVREGVMEFLLANHPLDCPICDQGGECDLQDQAMAYGTDKSRYSFGKRAVEDKELGPLVKTVMTRCIHCTRCVRFSTEVAGSPELGAIYRGEETEITPYLENIVTSELSGNVIDLCPVGALTSKPYAFVARPWEMKKTETFDVTDAMGSAITVQSRGNEVMRIAPRNDDDVNEEWISNKARFLVDGLKCQRLDKPYIRKNGKLESVSWEDALAVVAEKLLNAKDKLGFIAGSHTDIETLYATKLLANQLGAAVEGRRIVALPADNVAVSRFNPTFSAVDNADVILIIGSNPRYEAAVLNARIRKAWLQNDAKIGVIGSDFDTTYDYENLGSGADALKAILDGNDFSELLKEAHNPLIIVGENVIDQDGLSAVKLIQDIMVKYDVPPSAYAFLSTDISLQGVLELEFTYIDDIKKSEVIFSLAADEISVSDDAFYIYMGSHGDKGAERADIILPSAAYTEKDSMHISAEGRIRYLQRAVFPVGQAKEDWAILRALSGIMDMALPFNNFSELRAHLTDAYPSLNEEDSIISHEFSQINIAERPQAALYTSLIKEFYMTDPITRSSKVLRECQRSFYDEKNNTKGKVAA